MTEHTRVAPPYCPDCGTALNAADPHCPGCRPSTESQEFRSLVLAAQRAEQVRDWTQALEHWRDALQLLPPGTPESQQIAAHIEGLSRGLDQGTLPTAEPKKPAWSKWLGPLAPILLLLWKFKGLLLLVLSKGKLLLLGLTKFSTLSSMLLSMGAYWALYGWPFAVGLVLSIYIHEMGHVYQLRQLGIRASAPLFIPLLGAVVGLKQWAFSPREDARIGLAGPLWGFAGALITFAAYALTGLPMLAAVGHIAAWINLFNLLPVWQLDGGRGFHALTRVQRAIVAAAMVAIGVALGEGFLFLLALAAIYKVFKRDWPEEGDAKTLIQFIGLLIGLTLLLTIPAPRLR